jgi:excinuclease ABC subunit A
LPKLKISRPEAGAAKKIGAKLAVDRNQRPTQAAACIPYNKHPMAGKKNRSLWPLIVIGTAFSLLGLAAMLIAGWQIVSHLRAQPWEMQSAVLESLQTRDSPRSGSSLSARTSRVEGRYRYQFAGREYVGERLSFSIVRSNGFDDWDEQLRETLGAEGGAINILVNPDNPAESVALADIRWAEFAMETIRIRGARTHNLKNINLDLPRDQLIVITGLSGSGKSSLAFDTLYAEGQRRYVESLSAYARQFLQLMEKPDVDLIEGLSPRRFPSSRRRPRTTRVRPSAPSPKSTITCACLFARAGTPYCPDHNQPLEAQTVSQMVDTVLALPAETKLMILAPVVANRKGEQLDLFAELRAQGFARVRVDGAVYEIDAVPKLNKSQKHNVDVVVDRLKVRDDMRQRLAESFETALRHAEGRAIALEMESNVEHLFSAKFACPVCSYALQELEPRLFSFNNPMGACPKCDGLGVIQFFDPKRVVTQPAASLAGGAIRGWDKKNQFYFQIIESLADHYGFSVDTPWNELPEKSRQLILYGSGNEAINFRYLNEKGTRFDRSHSFEGIIPNLERRYRGSESNAVREELSKYVSSSACPSCAGTRLRVEARHVRVGTKTLHEISRLPLGEARNYFNCLTLTGAKAQVADKILKEITARLSFLINVGLDYLCLERSAETLSGGEAQRIRLASQIGSGLTGVMYVLDEPSIGLHQRDNDRLLQTLKNLRDMGNTVLVVEHDEDAIRSPTTSSTSAPAPACMAAPSSLRVRRQKSPPTRCR